jgi:hypothetical protein
MQWPWLAEVVGARVQYASESAKASASSKKFSIVKSLTESRWLGFWSLMKTFF